MALPEGQTRTYTLDEYIQLNPGDPGYIPLSEINILVDHPSFDRSKRYTLSQFVSLAQNVQAGRQSNLLTRSVVVTFSVPFSAGVVGWVKVYRSTTIPGVGIVRETVNSHDLVESITGITLTIDDNESLTGVIVEYSYNEG